jgi:hypothetical protein
VADIRDYLAMVAPASIHHRFTLLSKIKEYISENNIDIDEYNISVNGEPPLYKAYTTKIYELSGNDKKSIDEIKDVIFFNKYSEDGHLLLWGWYGIWSFSKQIPDKVNPARGFRLRKSNIQIGDEYCLVKLHKEPRGNFYYFGEVHAVHPELIPNARRDYFLENLYLKEFENYLQGYFKELYSSYHLSSKIRSAQRDISNLGKLDNQIQEKEQKGYKSYQEKEDLLKKRQEQQEKAEKSRQELLRISEKSKGNEITKRIVKELITDEKNLIQPINNPPSIEIKEKKGEIIILNNPLLSHLDGRERKLIKRVFDVVDNCLADKAVVENILQKIIEEFKQGKT